MTDIQPPVESWKITNSSTIPITINDIPELPVIKSKQTIEALDYTTANKLSNSPNFRNYLKNGTLSSTGYFHTHAHRDLDKLQGGKSNEYYHLSNSQHTRTTEFFKNTDITAEEAEILTDGSNADTLHIHTELSVPDHNNLDGLNVGNYQHLSELDEITLTDGGNADDLHTHTETSIPDHNNLDGLNVGDYQHLTESEETDFTTLTDGSDADDLHLHSHNNLDDLNVGDYQHLTELEETDFTTLTDGSDADDLHTHDSIANLFWNIRTVSSNYTLINKDITILCNAVLGSFTITLPTAEGREGKIYYIKKIDLSGNIVTIDGNGSETIDDGLTAILTRQYESITIQSDNSNWWII